MSDLEVSVTQGQRWPPTTVAAARASRTERASRLSGRIAKASSRNGMQRRGDLGSGMRYAAAGAGGSSRGERKTSVQFQTPHHSTDSAKP